MSVISHWTWISGSSAVVTLLLLALEGYPRLVQALELHQEWRTRTALLQQEPITPAERQHLESVRERLEVRLDAAFVDVPSREHLSSVVGSLQREADAAMVSLARVEPAPLVEDGAYAVLPLRVTARGSSHAIGGFVDRVERSPLLIKVRTLSVLGPGMRDGGVEASLDLDAVRLRHERPESISVRTGGNP